MPRLTAAQLADRKNGIGSSDIAEVVGVAPWEGSSSLRLFAEKRGMLPEEDGEPSEEQEIGHMLEPVLIDLYTRKSGLQTLPGGTVHHRLHPWAFASLDGKIIGKSAALEIKIVGIGMARGWDLLADDGIPHYVRCQVAWQAECADLDEVHVTTLITGTRHRVYYVQRDRELGEMLIDAGATFWRRIAAGDPPPVDGTDGCRTYLEAKYPSPATGQTIDIEAGSDIDLVGVERVLAARRERMAEDTKRMCDARMMTHMGETNATIMRAPTWRATWSIAKKAGAKRRFVVRPLDLGGAAAVAGDEIDAEDDGSPF